VTGSLDVLRAAITELVACRLVDDRLLTASTPAFGRHPDDRWLSVTGLRPRA
jgi:hypothetical protein